ncbi:helix-turn-helix domain-containing protein [Streptosporangium sp. NPDC048865]|uniref:helix-turn-helix domain-containing protein n=1 Tax=Streptosporangium sp. NPDC048865 TaxID=3155766 RepID=UPI003435B615
MLESLGLDPVEERVYRFLVTTAEAEVTDLIGKLGIDAETAETVLVSMRVRGLVTTVGPGRRRFAVVAPDIVLGSQLLRRRQALDRARREVERLSEEYRDTVRRRDAGPPAEVPPDRVVLGERPGRPRATPSRIAWDGVLTEGTSPCPLGSDDLHLVSLLVEGVPDTSIATRLGISRRTVRRRVSAIMRLAGARTRTQLAWRAATEHWL